MTRTVLVALAATVAVVVVVGVSQLSSSSSSPLPSVPSPASAVELVRDCTSNAFFAGQLNIPNRPNFTSVPDLLLYDSQWSVANYSVTHPKSCLEFSMALDNVQVTNKDNDWLVEVFLY
jgi:hypothetical protein